MRAQAKAKIDLSLELPPVPDALGEAEIAFAEARETLAKAERHLQITSSSINENGSPCATEEAIAFADRTVDEAKTALAATLARRTRLRHEFEAAARAALVPALIHLDQDVRQTVAHLLARLDEAQALNRQARSAGISLDAPILSAANRLRGITKLVSSALEMVAR